MYWKKNLQVKSVRNAYFFNSEFKPQNNIDIADSFGMNREGVYELKEDEGVPKKTWFVVLLKKVHFNFLEDMR